VTIVKVNVLLAKWTVLYLVKGDPIRILYKGLHNRYTANLVTILQSLINLQHSPFPFNSTSFLYITMDTSSSFKDVKALFFDVFGTVVDWRSTVTNELHTRAQQSLSKGPTNHAISGDVRARASQMTREEWGALAQKWRASYYAFTASIVRDPQTPYKTIDEHHHDALGELLAESQLHGLWDDEELRDISLIWHFLNPWADSEHGIHLLNKRFKTCTLSNGNISLLTDMARYGKLEWTYILSSNLFGTYKPNPKVYLGGAKELGLKPSQCGMVAAHLRDLQAAKDCGFKVVYVTRPQEESWGAKDLAEAKRRGWVDVWIDEDDNGFVTVAERLGVK